MPGTIKVFVTDTHELAGLGAARSLGRAGCRVTAGSPDAKRPAVAYSRFTAEMATYPDPWSDQNRFKDWLARQAKQYDAVLPVSEAALVAAADLGNIRAIVPPAASLPYILSKRAAVRKALKAGIRCPETAFDRDAAMDLPLPIIIKTDNRLTAAGRYLKGRQWYMENRRQLADLLDDLDRQGDTWIVQRCLPGHGVGAFLLRWGDRIHISFAHKRLHEVPFWGGWSSLREGHDAPELLADAARLLTATHFEGAGMVEFRRSGGKDYFLEINGRLWGSLALALHSNADFPKTLLECYLHGAPVDTPSPSRIGVRCRNIYPGEFGYLTSVLKGRGPVRGVKRPGKIRAVADFVLPSIRTRGDYFWWSDPLPGLCQGLTGVHSVAGAVADKVLDRLRSLHARMQATRFLSQCANRRPALDGAGTVLLLCYGNICRSPFAEAYWRQKSPGARTVSAGFHPEPGRQTPQRIVRAGRRWGLDLSRHRSRTILPGDVREADAIFVMDRWNLADLLARFPEARPKTWLLAGVSGDGEIPDPYFLEEEKALASLTAIARAIDAIFAKTGGNATAPLD
ncbi:MAG: ATP-grasp domain-containing protein [Desulfuromonadales bacterium]